MSSPVTDLEPTSEQFKVVPTKIKQNEEKSTIHGRVWNSQDYRYVCLMVHGLGAHSGWFEPLASLMAKNKVKTYSFDLAGFSTGKDRPVDSWTIWIDELKTVFEHIAKTESDKPVLLLGNSMGALIVLGSIKDLIRKPKLAILLSPGFGGYRHTFTLGYKVNAIVKALLSPKTMVKLPYSSCDITSSKSIQNAIDADKEASFSIPAGLGLELLKLTKHAIKEGKSLTCPLLLAQAGKDTIVDNDLIDKFYDGVKTSSKTRVIYEESFHDLVFENTNKALAEAIIEFADKLKAENKKT